MPGINQHHIPQLLQRGFGVKRSGKPKEIWVYQPDGTPELKLIKETASNDFFYSYLSEDGSPTLDDRITVTESPLATKLNELRSALSGTPVDPDEAATIVMHLVPSHLELK